MMPWRTVKNLFISTAAEVPFEVALALYMSHGYVFSGPKWFMMLRPILSTASEMEIRDAGKHWPHPDCWYVCAAAGAELRKLYKLMPYWLPKIAFHRNGGETLKVYDMRKFKRLVKMTKGKEL